MFPSLNRCLCTFHRLVHPSSINGFHQHGRRLVGAVFPPAKRGHSWFLTPASGSAQVKHSLVPSFVNTQCTKRAYTTASGDKVVINGAEIHEVNEQNAGKILEKYDSILLDCDGVLWSSDHISPLFGIPAAIKTLQSLGKQVLFVTNNSMHCRRAYVDKFRQNGFDAPAEDVFCVAYASAVYLQTIMHVEGSVYVIGSPGMSEELDIAGIKNFGLGPDPDPVYTDISDLLRVPLRDDVTAVLVGYDKHFNLNKLFKACSYLSNESCLYLATNDKEKSVRIAEGRRQPLTGAIVDAVTSAVKRRPEVLGKPDTHLFQCIKATHPSINPARSLMVGDSLITDIGLAKAVGMDSALVLTGVGSLDTVRTLPGLEPTYFMRSLAVIAGN